MSEAKCPMGFSAGSAPMREPEKLNLKILSPTSYCNNYNYAEEFKTVDLDELKADLFKVLTTSQDWWPADYGNYGPFFIRMAWHSAGTYRNYDGRGGANTGNQRFSPLDSWPDNGNLDKARRLLWPIKQKYGRKLSWADLMIFAGTYCMEQMGFAPFGFAGGRVDAWAPEEDVYWGPETVMMDSKRYAKDMTRGDKDSATLQSGLAAVQMGLIYVNPEGPNGNCDPQSSAHDIRETFARMSMNDEETVALVAGGHTFGKGHGAGPADLVGPAPVDAKLEEQGFGWKNSFKSGKGEHATTSGLEGAWTSNPAQWDHGYFTNLFKYEWKQTKTPAGATLWIPTDPKAANLVPDAHNPKKSHAPVMFTSDLALRVDPSYRAISQRFLKDKAAFADAWGRAWYKLTHRDMGPHSRFLGKFVAPQQIWQDPVPTGGILLNPRQTAELKASIMKSGLTISQLVKTAWASASTHRITDFRGGANGGRICLEPQKSWKVNDPEDLAVVLKKLAGVQKAFPGTVSMADLIVLGGSAAIEAAAAKAGHSVSVPFLSGRTDATDAQTDAATFAVLEPKVDGFRNHLPCPVGQVHALVDRAHMLGLTAPEMTVLVGGMRALNANTAGSQVGVLTHKPGELNNAFFVNLLDMGTSWSPVDASRQLYEGKDAAGKVVWTASSVDLVFGSNSELRAISEYYACADSLPAFLKDFVAAWVKVMNLDRFEAASTSSSTPSKL